jgi:hypothetical protein
MTKVSCLSFIRPLFSRLLIFFNRQRCHHYSLKGVNMLSYKEQARDDRPLVTHEPPPVAHRAVLSEADLASRWGMSPKTLQRWRIEGRGPRYFKLGKRVSYPLEMVLAFEQRSIYESTSRRVDLGDAA